MYIQKYKINFKEVVHMTINIIKDLKKPKNFRLKESTIEILNKIAKDNQCNNTDVIEFLINNYHNTEGVKSYGK